MNRNQRYILLMSLSLAGYVWIGWNSAGVSATPTACMFKAVTHLPCPSCGTTRAVVLLMHGDIRGSLLVNPFGVVAALILVILPIWVVIDTLRKSDSLYRVSVAAELQLARNKWVSIPAVAVVLINWFWSIARGF